MKKEETKAPIAAEENARDAVRTGNEITDKAIQDAMAEIDKEKDDKKKRMAKKQLCIGTYVNRKTVYQLQQRRREDDITKEKLNASKVLLERLLGYECDIKDGECIPNLKKPIDKKNRLTPTEHEAETKKMEEEFKKKIDAKDVLTPTEHENETKKMEEDFRKKTSESDKQFDDAMRELRNSYEGEYRHYVESYWY